MVFSFILSLIVVIAVVGFSKYSEDVQNFLAEFKAQQKNIKDLELLQQQINNDKLLIENKYINYVIIDNRS